MVAAHLSGGAVKAEGTAGAVRHRMNEIATYNDLRDAPHPAAGWAAPWSAPQIITQVVQYNMIAHIMLLRAVPHKLRPEPVDVFNRHHGECNLLFPAAASIPPVHPELDVRHLERGGRGGGGGGGLAAGLYG